MAFARLPDKHALWRAVDCANGLAARCILPLCRNRNREGSSSDDEAAPCQRARVRDSKGLQHQGEQMGGAASNQQPAPSRHHALVSAETASVMIDAGYFCAVERAALLDMGERGLAPANGNLRALHSGKTPDLSPSRRSRRRSRRLSFLPHTLPRRLSQHPRRCVPVLNALSLQPWDLDTSNRSPSLVCREKRVSTDRIRGAITHIEPSEPAPDDTAASSWRAPSMDSQQKPPGGDVKPRLTKEQHDILEHQFQQQHKPTTLIKKGFASDLNVSLDKINNWFQNRRAKVKQDRKKLSNQQSMQLNMYGHMHQQPVIPGHYQPHANQPHLRMPMSMPVPMSMPMPTHQDFFPVTPDVGHASIPIQSIEAPVIELSSPMSVQQQQFNMQHSLRSIPEANQPMPYHQNTVMHQIMAATHEASQHHGGMAINEPNYSYDTSGLPLAFSNDHTFAVPATESAPLQEQYESFAGMGTLDYSALAVTNSNTSSSTEAHNSTGSLSTESSPFSSVRSCATTRPMNGSIPSSVASLTSVYSGWTDNQASGAAVKQEPEYEDNFLTPYNLTQASASEQTLSSWDQTGTYDMFPRSDFYHQHNASAQAVLPGQEQQQTHKPNAPYLDYEAPTVFNEDVFARRNSSTTNLAINIEAINIRNGTPDDFKQPSKLSSIAARRHKRPAALNSTAMRSASYTAGMHSASLPSPIGNNDHTLRRIRSSGISNAAGRIQKSQPGSAPRSPMAMNFSDVAASPKFSRTFSSSHTTILGPGGSLAPPTPQTPQEGIPWQGNTIFRHHPVMPEHNSPESMNTNWSAEPQSAGIYSKGASPHSTPLNTHQLNHTHIPNENGYHDSPPQSAPATQQNFHHTGFIQSPHMRAGFHSSSDLTAAESKQSHSRRPSLPDNAQTQVDESAMPYPYHGGHMNFDDLKTISLDGVSHNLPFAPHHSFVPDYIVQPDTSSEMLNPYNNPIRRTAEPQQRNYIFANQGPGDFN
ncbi:hypothetical protein P153DRAFT_383517 [Dothidotthia symphoricarpi CBS 119687]|uniref:Homeobox domain-containing protein n=1 Tax=Dothidotthia symphoricarpi CBS 119687 TaxID=1392245 RepID=A0A6A6AIM0_9PLEO|nr:uncharacterized protein P153DRAFT_383517 [Dothidotthia symphoricarpi CBS 119687]KAF2131406.1 hypothetical protein P153DRAFT_383517 [Dothidotthia symphoricarpi CBS 119687]